MIGNMLGVDLGKNPSLLSQEVNLSNICNLKCRMCDSSRSSKWIPDEMALGIYSEGSNRSLMESGWTLENPDTIRRLVFLGGEPLMHQDSMIRDLTAIRDIGRLGEISLHFNTNMTHQLDPILVDLMIECKNVNINVSIDGYGALNDYIRSDSNWSDIIENMKRLDDITKDHSNITWQPVNTVTVFNCNKMHEIYEWFSVSFETMGQPTEAILAWEPRCFSVINLPIQVKHRLLKDYNDRLRSAGAYKPHWEALIGYIKHEPNMTEDLFLREFNRLNEKLDKRRMTSFREANPELFGWLEECRNYDKIMRFDLHDRPL